MNKETKGKIAAFLHVLSIGPVFLSAAFVKIPLPLTSPVAYSLGVAFILTGGLLFLWASFHLKGEARGEVKPETDKLVREGPYRLLRHPMYLGMVVALTGFFTWMRNSVGVVAVFVFFLPFSIYRAKLEEGALSKKFGARFEEYADETGFMFPLSY